MTEEELYALRNQLPNQAEYQKIYRKIRENWDGIAKPLDGLGELEHMVVKIGAIQKTTAPSIDKRAVAVLCADNGVVAQGISQSGQEVTAIVANNMAVGRSSVCHMAKVAGAQVYPVDIGINADKLEPGVLDYKIAKGTRDFTLEPAMTKEETLQAIETGIQLVGTWQREGVTLLATGEMGIGNTTTSSAMAAALLQCPVHEITGRGAGLDDAGLARKIQIIEQALKKYGLVNGDVLEILCDVGGFDIAGLCGIFMGGALYQVPIIIDGVISSVAALTAERLVPGLRHYMLPSHRSRERAATRILEELGLHPVIDGGLALGEGTGAVLLFSMLDMALAVYNSRTTFEEIAVKQYERFT